MILEAVAPWRRSLIAVVLAVAACSCARYGGEAPSAGAPTPGLSGTTWRIEDVGGSAVADASQTELRIGSDGKVSGSTGCNNFTGSATIEGTSLSFSPLAATRKACEERLMAQESSILGALQSVRSFALAQDGRANLLDAGGQAVMRLVRANS